MGLVLALLIWPRLLEIRRLADVIIVHLGFKAVVCGLWEHALLFKDRHDAQRLEGEQSVSLTHLYESHL